MSLRRKLSSLQHRLPDPLQRLIRQRYYLGVVQKYKESDWEWSPFIKPLVAPGSTVLDIGANVGYLTGLFARFVGPQGRVIAAEPIPATHDALEYSMKKLYPDTVVTIQTCVSHREGEVTMAVPEYEGGGANYYESRVVEKGGGEVSTYKVRATTLEAITRNLNPNHNLSHNPNRGEVEARELKDFNFSAIGGPAFGGQHSTLNTQHPSEEDGTGDSRAVRPGSATPATAEVSGQFPETMVSLIKIDVEGHELAVIRGGAGFFARHRPPLLIEVAGDPDEEGSSAAEMFGVMAGWGYRPHLIKDGKLLERVRGDRSVDYLFISP